ncbi:hypothetical protein DL89DRAFT_60525 [Linderina pennispora]|uniref:Zinc-ribbon 15 domain-containing protein n=1 Tax=Linderina pennispora TaxID=61395 RepID=A0A1Y1VZY0_9FUNG|nr:uncharacterized protein DL89DRAFT_60525 [Linderina pennispora]ORX66821.1 hypothetical protein DL89DRAFT_60525 [Linderina pennispora]
MCDFIPIFILFGSYNSVRSLGSEAFACPRCHNPAIHTISRRSWLTVFFVPVCPISSRKTLYHCTICSWEGIPMAVTRLLLLLLLLLLLRSNHHRHHKQKHKHQPEKKRPAPAPASGTSTSASTSIPE